MSSETVVKNCKVLDAQFFEHFSEDQADYTMGIKIVLLDMETQAQLAMSLTDKELRELVGINRDFTSKELIFFAEKLRSRFDPIKVNFSPDQVVVMEKTPSGKSKEETITEMEVELPETMDEVSIEKFVFNKEE